MRARELVDEVVRAINARDKGAIEKLMTDDVQLRFPPALVFYGHDGVRGYVDELEARLPDLTMVTSHIYTGDDYAVVEWDASGHSADQRPVQELGCLVLQLRDGLIARANLYGDPSLWRELGQRAHPARP